MYGTRLAERLDGLPLVLCGPILRRVDDQSVTVWVALRKPRKVRLEVYPHKADGGWDGFVLEGEADTISLGENLHIVAVTAKAPLADPQRRLSWGQRYGYDVFFQQNVGSTSDKVGVGGLFAPPASGRTGVVGISDADAKERLTYPDGPSLPSFVLPPDAASAGGAHPLERLRIFQGSCRKAHAAGEDALPILDDVIAAAHKAGAVDPQPHMLLLTGDQIYADDVADCMLAMLIDASQALLKWELKNENEVLPGPGLRSDFAKVIGLTAMRGLGPGGWKTAKSHLMRFSEFAAMYLFAWSDVLWPLSPPSSDAALFELSAKEQKKRAKLFNEERAQVSGYGSTVRKVRRAMANTPVYMIFDDHEITDDWNLNRLWESKVYDNVGGRRHVLNGLLAYALFQAWGNTPDRFDVKKPATPGGKLLAAASRWRGQSGPSDTLGDEATISACLNIPTYANGLRQDVRNYDDFVHWHYDIQTPAFQCLVLDTRTMRGFPGGPDDSPDLLNDEGFKHQIRQSPLPAAPADLTMVVATTNVVSEPLTETAAELGGLLYSVRADRGDAWEGQTEAFERLLVELAHRASPSATAGRKVRLAIASGDIHYGFAVRGQYWSDKGGYRPPGAPWSQAPLDMVFAEITASAFHNQAGATEKLHHFGFGTLGDVPLLMSLMSTSWIGWPSPPKPNEVEIKPEDPGAFDHYPLAIGRTLTAARHVRDYRRQTVLARKPSLLKLDGLGEGSMVRKAPDWTYRVDFIKDNSPDLTQPSIAEARGSKQDRAAQVQALSEAHTQYVEDGAGRIIVGRNNIGEVRFDWADEKVIEQRLWWRLVDGAAAAPLTQFRVPLGFDEPNFPKPTYPGEQ